MRGVARASLAIGVAALALGRLAFATEGEPKRLSVAEAHALVRASLKPSPDTGFDPAQPFSLQEWKHEALWGRLEAQVFRVIEDNWPRATLLVHKGQVIPLGLSFGGLGVGSLCVTDLDGDKQPELLFTYAWGSGVHRAELGIVRFASTPPKWEPVGLCYVHGDLALERVSDQRVKVLRATVLWGDNPQKAAEGAALRPGAALATVEFDGAARRIVAKPVDGLDAATRKNLVIGVPEAEPAE